MRRRAYAVVVLALAAAIATTMVTIASAGPSSAPVHAARRPAVRAAAHADAALAGDRRSLRVLLRRLPALLAAPGDRRSLRTGRGRARTLTLVSPPAVTCSVGLGQCSLHPCVELVGAATAIASPASPAVATAVVVTARPGHGAPGTATAVTKARPGRAPTVVAVPAVQGSPCVRAPATQSVSVSVETPIVAGR